MLVHVHPGRRVQRQQQLVGGRLVELEVADEDSPSLVWARHCDWGPDERGDADADADDLAFVRVPNPPVLGPLARLGHWHVLAPVVRVRLRVGDACNRREHCAAGARVDLCEREAVVGISRRRPPLVDRLLEASQDETVRLDLARRVGATAILAVGDSCSGGGDELGRAILVGCEGADRCGRPQRHQPPSAHQWREDLAGTL